MDRRFRATLETIEGQVVDKTLKQKLCETILHHEIDWPDKTKETSMALSLDTQENDYFLASLRLSGKL